MLSLEPLLRSRLDGVAEEVPVLGAADLAAAVDGLRRTPCLFVVPDGYAIVDQRPDGSLARINTRWLVIVAVKHVQPSAFGEVARVNAQSLLAACIERLLGWRPGPGYQPLLLHEAPRPAAPDGVLWFPLAFTCQQCLKHKE